MAYCKVIGQRYATLICKQGFFIYKLTKLRSREENINKFIKEGIKDHIKIMRDKGCKYN
jgi:hypothetical protein